MGYKLNEFTDLFYEAYPDNDSYRRFSEAYGSSYGILGKTMNAIIAALAIPRVNRFIIYDGIINNANRMRDEADLVLVQNPGSGSAVDAILKSLVDGFTRVPEIEAYINPNRNNKVYTNGKCTVVSFNGTDRTLWMRGLSAFAKLCPWVFKDKPITENDFAFLKAMSEYNNQHSFFEAVDDIFDRYMENSGLMKIRLEKAAAAIFTSSKEKKIKEYREQITRMRNRVQEYQRNISDYLVNIKETTDKLNIAVSKDTNAEKEEFVDMLNSGNIEVVSYDDGRMTFIALSTLSCYDEGEVDAYVLNQLDVLKGNSNWCYPYELENMPYSVEEMRAFYTAVFVDHRMDIKLAAKYTIYEGGSVNANSVDETLKNDCINNPNIGYAGCLGGYANDLSDAEDKEDYFAAVAICQQSASSVNLGEIWPMGKVTQDLVLSNGKVIRTANGDITFAEAMNIIKEELRNK